VTRANETLEIVEGAWAQDINLAIKKGEISEWRENMKVTIILKE